MLECLCAQKTNHSYANTLITLHASLTDMKSQPQSGSCSHFVSPLFFPPYSFHTNTLTYTRNDIFHSWCHPCVVCSSLTIQISTLISWTSKRANRIATSPGHISKLETCPQMNIYMGGSGIGPFWSSLCYGVLC